MAHPKYYDDTGCELNPKCDGCPIPLEKCPAWRSQYKSRALTERIVKLARQGKTNEQIAALVGRSKRTVQRRLSSGSRV